MQEIWFLVASLLVSAYNIEGDMYRLCSYSIFVCIGIIIGYDHTVLFMRPGSASLAAHPTYQEDIGN